MRVVVVAALALLATACALDPGQRNRTARLRLGVNSRALATAPAPTVAFREVSPSTPSPTATEAYTGTAQFAQRYLKALYLGGELEAGRMNARGSNYAGAYGVIGADFAAGFGTVGLECVAGWRGIRAALDEIDENAFVAEPRVRADLPIGEKVTLGGVAGTTLGERGTFMIGLQLGVFSDALR